MCFCIWIWIWGGRGDDGEEKKEGKGREGRTLGCIVGGGFGVWVVRVKEAGGRGV